MGETMNARRWLRAGLWFLTAAQLVVGGCQLFLPKVFYDDFPVPGNSWVSMLPPYNEHLMRDVGALNLAVAVAVGAAAIYLERRLVVVSLLAYEIWAIPHAVFHSTHLEHYSAGDAIGQTILLVLAVLLPGALLTLTAVTPGKSLGKPAALSRP
jgi:hypothetical protein